VYKLTHLKAQTLKPGFRLIGSTVETGRFQALWVNWMQPVHSPLTRRSAT
jgi:hypothetical protein